MSARTSVTVRVPATTANLGPGYDCLGLALGLHNEMTLSVIGDEADARAEGGAEPPCVHIEGEGCDCLARDSSHLVLCAARAAANLASRSAPLLGLRQVNRIPLARGLGSSSAAIVGGIFAANKLLGLELSSRQMLDLATEVEGHPDNVAPALLGGLTVCCSVGNEVLVRRLEVAPGLACVAAVPDFEVATREARRALPETVPHADAVFNLCRVGLSVAALVSGEFALLGEAMRDRLHQPYRARLVPGMDDAIAAALEAGAHGACLSGSGPTIAAFVSGGGEEVGAAMVKAFARAGVRAETHPLALCAEGAQVV